MSRATVDLPQPDSPTSDSVSPRLMVNDTPSTARSSCFGARSMTRFNHGRETSKSLARFLTLSSGLASATRAPLVMQPARRHRLSRWHQPRSLDAAAAEHLRAARIERAAQRDGIEARHRSLDLRQALAPPPHRLNPPPPSP